ncbi:hypothetical protein OG357_01750 [Streptomyces sp. NBC_01255]|uniref:hypothetical protein n=1 Tax=Streptomyces sp. NBC_01255 TaxID=2903798 RepID=UPI002E304E1E|nr:hypothetical protein [Streptomyces sp. NBC_01255]
MLEEGLTVLAAAGGAAVVQAAGTSSWQGFQQAAARWFGRGGEERVHVELDRSAHALAAVQDGEAGTVRRDQQAAWQARFEAVLVSLSDAERRSAADALDTLLQEHRRDDGVSAAGDGQAVRGDVQIRAEHGSVAALRMGDVSLGNPSQPGPPRG